MVGRKQGRLSEENRQALAAEVLKARQVKLSAEHSYNRTLAAANHQGMSIRDLAAVTGDARSLVGRWIASVD